MQLSQHWQQACCRHRVSSRSSSSSTLHTRLVTRPLHRLPKRSLYAPRLLKVASSGPQQQPDGSDADLAQQQQLQEEQQQQSGAAAPELDAEAEAMLAAEDAELQLQWEQQQQEQQAWEEQHLKWCRTSRNIYLLLALGLTVSGAFVAFGAGPIAAAGLKLGLGLQAQQAAVLVGCFGAAIMRAASLAWFLAEGAAWGELGSWRYQRINLGLATAALAAAAAALTAGWAGAQPWLLLLLVGGCTTTAAACLSMAFGQARHDGFYFASAVGYGDVFEGFGTAFGYLLYNVTCLPGALMTGMAVLGVGLGVAALSGSAMLPLLPWLAASCSGVAAATLMHKLLGAGLLLLALQSWALSEYASNGRDISPETSVKLLYVRTSEEHAVNTGLLGPAPVHAPLRRFDLLHLGFIAAAVAQGSWLAQAAASGSGLGVVNIADPLWGSLFWGVMGTVLYLLVLVAKMDFGDVWHSCLRVLDWAGGLVSLGTSVLYADWMWLSQVQRR